MREKRYCDCALSVGKCYCGVDDSDKKKTRKRFNGVDILDKKEPVTVYLGRKTFFALNSKLKEMGLYKERDAFIEGLIDEFLYNLERVKR